MPERHTGAMPRQPSLLAWLFLLPPDQRRPWPWRLDAVARRVGTWLIHGLDIEPPASPGRIVWRLFVRSPDQTATSSVARTGRRSGQRLAGLASRMPALRQLQAQEDPPGVGGGLVDATLRHKWLRWLLISIALVLAVLVASTPMNWQQQMWFGSGLFAIAILLRNRAGRAATLVLISFSVIASLRYFWWRVNYSLDLESPIEMFLGLGLFGAECYALLILLLGYLQSAWPLRRQPIALPDNRNEWPTVDVFIPTYNESLDIVRPTVFAAQNLDWPADKLRIYLLDDGRREAFREFAEATGVTYMTRDDNRHAKAGNLNRALARSDGDFVAIFDCDHMPVRSFLQTNMGWMLADPSCALVQTPHHFFSPDPLERNLGTFRRVPNEGRLFYGLIQDGNDLWNATFFCGSCAILRRGPLEEVGGIAVETVTEDAHTALKLHRRGYNSVYVNIVQAAGLATESLAGHIGQRIRWARGMAQIFSGDNPFRGRGLTLFQRLCYSNSMLHFLHGIPRLVFLTAPLAYLYFGWHVFNAEAVVIAAFALPHLAQAMLANSKMQGRFRHSYWAEVYESLLAWYITLPTTLALINPRLGKFNVTAKGGQVSQSYFDWRISVPFIVLMLLGLGGFSLGILWLFIGPPEETATVLLNLAWTSYNLIILGAALGVAREHRQLRRTHRVEWREPVQLQFPDGSILDCESLDFSLGGMHLALPEPLEVDRGTAVAVALPRGGSDAVFPARVVIRRDDHIRVAFDSLSLAQQRALVGCTFSRPDAWAGWDDSAVVDRPLSSLRDIFYFGLRGYGLMFSRLLGIHRLIRPTHRQSASRAT